MTKYFTSDSGEKFEEVPQKYKEKDTLVIRPIKPKWSVFLDPKYNLIKIDCGTINRDQAQLIKEASEALMEYITGSDMDASSPSWFTIEADRARQSIMEDK